MPDAGHHGKGKHDENHARVPAVLGAGFVMVKVMLSLGGLEVVLNGLITNNKFCLTRMGRLRLSWLRAGVRAVQRYETASILKARFERGCGRGLTV